MTPATVVELGRVAIEVTLLVAAPLFLAALVTGLVVSIFQAATQINEMTLTFVPKIGLMLVVFWVSMSFMTATLASFFTDQLLPQIAGS